MLLEGGWGQKPAPGPICWSLPSLLLSPHRGIRCDKSWGIWPLHQGSSQMALSTCWGDICPAMALGAASREMPSCTGATPSPPATWKAYGHVSTFAQKVLEETKCLITQKIWCWQLANKLLAADTPSSPPSAWF